MKLRKGTIASKIIDFTKYTNESAKPVAIAKCCTIGRSDRGHFYVDGAWAVTAVRKLRDAGLVEIIKTVGDKANKYHVAFKAIGDRVPEWIDRSAAKNATAQELEKIYIDSGELTKEYFHTIRGNLARNPNTPLDVLQSIGWFYLPDLDRNPSLSLILLEVPTFARSLIETGVNNRYANRDEDDRQSLVKQSLHHILCNALPNQYPRWFIEGLS